MKKILFVALLFFAPFTAKALPPGGLCMDLYLAERTENYLDWRSTNSWCDGYSEPVLCREANDRGLVFANASAWSSYTQCLIDHPWIG